MIRDISINDAESIAQIYNYYILHTIITFENNPVSSIEMGNRIKEITAHLPWIVYQKQNKIIGYAYASSWKSRCSYKHTVETSIYLSHDQKQKGLGTLLYCALLRKVKQQHFHTVIAGMALPNRASIALHEKLGFQKIAHFKEVGYKFNQWIDVGYWQLMNKGTKKN